MESIHHIKRVQDWISRYQGIELIVLDVCQIVETYTLPAKENCEEIIKLINNEIQNDNILSEI